jgi:hypothetical protein
MAPHQGLRYRAYAAAFPSRCCGLSLKNVRSRVRWQKGYASSLSGFSSKIPRFKGRHVGIDGTSRFIVRGGLIAEYRESVNGGVAMAQVGVEPDRTTKVFTRWTGWLRERPETVEYVARPKGS